MEDTKTELFAILRTIKEQEKAVQEAIFKLEKAAAETERRVAHGIIQRVEQDCVVPLRSAVMDFRGLSVGYMVLLFAIGFGFGGYGGAEYMARRADQRCQLATDRFEQWIDELRKPDGGSQKRKK